MGANTFLQHLTSTFCYLLIYSRCCIKADELRTIPQTLFKHKILGFADLKQITEVGTKASFIPMKTE